MSAMSALGLAGYSSSDAEEQDTGLGLGTDMTNASLANASIQMPAAAEHIRATASEPIASDTFGRFGRYKKRVKVTRRGLPLFSDPVDAGDRSDSGDEAQLCRKRTRAVGTEGLSFLPAPIRALPIHEQEQAPEQVVSPSADLAPAETSEMYRVGVTSAGLPSVSMNTASTTPEALLAKSIKFGQHVELKDIRADEIQRAAPHEKSEIDALRTAMGSEHAKKVQESAGHHMPSKRQKQRHQLNSLFHRSQMTELHDMERKLTHTRSKAQTAAKYGW